MADRINLRFRPGLIIFVDEAGVQICEHFKTIVAMTDLDEILHQSIALLQVKTGSDEAVPCPVQGDFPTNDPMPTEPGPLGELVEESITNIRLYRRIKEIMDAEYQIPEPRPQIYIVGEAASPHMAHVLRVVQERLAAIPMTTLVSYVLSAYRHIPRQSPVYTDPYDHSDPLMTLGSSPYWGGRQVTNFCYIYENMLYPTHTSVTETDSHYAAAEALFMLLATGITPDPVFQRYMQVSPNPSQYDNVGSISTSLIIFPRETLLTYCSSLLGVALMQQWLQELHEDDLEIGVRKKQQERARGDVEDIEQWIKDLPPRPFANTKEKPTDKKQRSTTMREDNRWPNLDILTQSNNLVPARLLNTQKDLHRRLREQTASLFKLFQFEYVEREALKQRQSSATWTRQVYRNSGKAVDAFAEWDKVASVAWVEAEQRISAEVKHTVDQLWSNQEQGFAQARAYIDEFDDELARLQDRLGHWREAHEDEYSRSLDRFEALADGEWIADTTAIGKSSGTLGSSAAQATPTMGGRTLASSTNSAASSGGTTIIGNPTTSPTSPATYQHLPPREEQIVQGLEQRIAWFQDQLPSAPTQVAIGIPFLLASALSSLAFFSGAGYLVFGVALLLIFAATFGVNVSLSWRYRREIKGTREDLLKFYRRYYCYKCEKREDDLRRRVIVPLRLKVLRIREKLDDISSFITAIQTGLSEQANSAQRNFFSSPSGVRDVFVANGERLQKSRKNTIEQFAGQVTVRRMKDPKDDRHRTSQDMKEMLIASFSQLPESIIEMDEEQAQQHIYQFTRGIIAQYLKDDLVSIRSALNKADVWHEVLDRVQNSFYRTQVGIREPELMFVCGREADINISSPFIPRGTHTVELSDQHDWMLVAAFFRGGSPTAIDPDVLFPKALPSPP